MALRRSNAHSLRRITRDPQRDPAAIPDIAHTGSRTGGANLWKLAPFPTTRRIKRRTPRTAPTGRPNERPGAAIWNRRRPRGRHPGLAQALTTIARCRPHHCSSAMNLSPIASGPLILIESRPPIVVAFASSTTQSLSRSLQVIGVEVDPNCWTELGVG